MTDWKAKFDSVVKDTENSLQNVKKRLVLSRESAKTALQPNSSLSGVAIGACTCPVHTDSRGSNNNHGVRFNDNTDTGFKDDYRAVAPSDNFHVTPVTPYQPSTDFLQDNIDRQRSMIQNLGESVDSVNKEHELLRKQVSDLLDEVSFMKKQQAVQVAAPAAERNSDIWRRDMELGMKGLEVQLRQKQTQHDGMTLLSAQFTALQSNFTEMRRTMLNSLNSMQSQLSSFTSRLDELESKVSEISADNRQLQQYQQQVTLNNSMSVDAKFRDHLLKSTERRDTSALLARYRQLQAQSRAKHSAADLDLSDDDDTSTLDSLSLGDL